MRTRVPDGLGEVVTLGAGGRGRCAVEVSELLEDEGEELLDVAPLAPLGGLADGLEAVGVEVAELGGREAGRYGESCYGATGGAWMGSPSSSSIASRCSSSQVPNGASSRPRCSRLRSQ